MTPAAKEGMLAGDEVTWEMPTADVGMQAVDVVTPETPTMDLVTPAAVVAEADARGWDMGLARRSGCQPSQRALSAAAGSQPFVDVNVCKGHAMLGMDLNVQVNGQPPVC